MRRLAILLLLLAPGALRAAEAPPWETVVPGVDYRHILRAGLDAHAVRIDLDHDGLRVVATTGCERGLTVGEFAMRTGALVAVNGDYFDLELRPVGLAMGAGRVWSHPVASIRRQEVVAAAGRRVRIVPRAEPLPTPEPWMTDAVSGWPMVVDGCEPLAALPGGDHFTRAPHPRTAVGLSGDGRQLYLVVVDGRREDAPGLTLPGLATLMHGLGACTAVNLDGGGSSALWLRDRIVNRPSDGLERAVANHLAVLGVDAPPRVDCAPDPEADRGRR